MKALLARLCLLSLVFSFPAARAELASAGPEYKVIAYYYGEGAERQAYRPDRIPAEKLTHLMYAFANIRNGKAVLDNPSSDNADSKQLAGLRVLKQQHPHLKVLLSIGGWTWSKYFSDVALNPKARQRFTASAVALMHRYDFDGLDIDWEYPVEGGAEGNIRRPEDKANYTLLLKALRDGLDRAGRPGKRHYLLTSATGAGERWLAHTEMSVAIHYLDWVNLMSYDFNGLWNKFSGHVAPLHHDPAYLQPGTSATANVGSAVDLYLQAGVPANKIVLGVPFYGYAWGRCAAKGNGQYQDCNGPGAGANSEGSISFDRLVSDYIDRNGYRRYWNDVTRTPYLFKAETGDFISYEDPESLDYKLQFLKQKGLAGAMFWELTNDSGKVLLDRLHLRLRADTR
ncbi:glycoside hydrolase family 18 protein [Chitinimonas naiadis]